MSFKVKIIAELVTERKRLYSLNQDLVQKLQDNAANGSKLVPIDHHCP
jgi:hypothetical protein